MKKIPIEKAKDISKDCEFDMVIVIGINNDTSGSIATYGKNKKLCKIAGDIGQNKLKDIIFGDDGILANYSKKSNE